jgi:hypothetical protein
VAVLVMEQNEFGYDFGYEHGVVVVVMRVHVDVESDALEEVYVVYVVYAVYVVVVEVVENWDTNEWADENDDMRDAH